MKLVPLICALACPVIFNACSSADSKPEAPGAIVEGDRIQIPENSPQRSSLVTEVVEPCKNSSLRLSGKLTWDDNVTVRIFTPFGGRVAKILGEAGQLIEKDQPLAL